MMFLFASILIYGITIKSIQAVGQKLYIYLIRKKIWIYLHMHEITEMPSKHSLIVVMYMLHCISSYFWFTEMLWIPVVRNSKLGTTYRSLKIWGHFLQDDIWLFQQVYQYLNLGPQLVMLNRIFLYNKSKVLYIYY